MLAVRPHIFRAATLTVHFSSNTNNHLYSRRVARSLLTLTLIAASCTRLLLARRSLQFDGLTYKWHRAASHSARQLCHRRPVAGPPHCRAVGESRVAYSFMQIWTPTYGADFRRWRAQTNCCCDDNSFACHSPPTLALISNIARHVGTLGHVDEFISRFSLRSPIIAPNSSLRAHTQRPPPICCPTLARKPTPS